MAGERVVAGRESLIQARDEGEYELRCLSPRDLYMLGHALESVYAEDGADGELRWPGRDSRPEELWFLIAMVYGHEGGRRMRPPLSRVT